MWLHLKSFSKMPIINFRDGIISFSSNLKRINVLLDMITFLFPEYSYCLYPAFFFFLRFFKRGSLLLPCGTIMKVALIRNITRFQIEKQRQSYILIHAFSSCCPSLVLWLLGLNYSCKSLRHAVECRTNKAHEWQCLDASYLWGQEPA